MANFFSRLSYSFGYEDHLIEEEALKLKSTDTVLCITGSGDRPLHALASSPKKVIALDANATQNHLLELKVAAMRSLDFDEYLSFLGAIPHPNRRSVLSKLSMSPSSTLFWKRYHRLVSKGILFEGNIEKTCFVGASLLHLALGKQINALFSFNDLHAQNIFLSTVWNPTPLKRMLSLFLHPLFSRRLIQDPTLYAHVDPSITPSTYVYDRMMNLLSHTLARKSPLLAFLLKGTVSKDAYPFYLTQQGFMKIKPNLDRLDIVTEPLIPYLLKSKEESFDAFSLSNIASYMDQEGFNELASALYRTGKKGSRFCLRQFLSNHTLPEKIPFKRDLSLESKLSHYDKSFIYRSLVGQKP